jgi:hypothetical protein
MDIPNQFASIRLTGAQMNQDSTAVFTPLRMALLTAIAVSNLLALISFANAGQAWAEPLKVFAVVFIMLFVFVILLELVWMHHRAKTISDENTLKKYRVARMLYGLFFVSGFVIGYVVLLW